VLQVSEEEVCRAIPLQSKLKLLLVGEEPPANIYLLFDCNKKSCCTDIIGAKHVGYDLLVHIGEACFSEKYNERHYYMFAEAVGLKEKLSLAKTKSKEFCCDAILLGQGCYS